IYGVSKRSTYHNYFLGNDPSKWVDHVPLFDGVFYEGIYENIDARILSESGNFKYDLILNPGADHSQIMLDYEGLENIFVNAGDLVLKTSVGEFIELAPYAYQVIDGNKVEVPCHYLMTGTTSVAFDFPEGYDPATALIIDPVLVA